MIATYKALAATFSGVALALLLAPNLTAECGGVPQPKIAPSSWLSQPGSMQTGQPRLLRTALTQSSDQSEATPSFAPNMGVVGFWHIKFLSQGTTGIKDGTEVDAGYSQWHSDFTEIMNSGGRPPNTSNFCLGVWKQVGNREYLLNHVAIAWDPTGEQLLGPAYIREDVFLSTDATYFVGTFTIDQYNKVGKTLGHVQGVIKGTRVTVDTPFQSIF